MKWEAIADIKQVAQKQICSLPYSDRLRVTPDNVWDLHHKHRDASSAVHCLVPAGVSGGRQGRKNSHLRDDRCSVLCNWKVKVQRLKGHWTMQKFACSPMASSKPFQDITRRVRPGMPKDTQAYRDKRAHMSCCFEILPTSHAVLCAYRWGVLQRTSQAIWAQGIGSREDLIFPAQSPCTWEHAPRD